MKDTIDIKIEGHLLIQQYASKEDMLANKVEKTLLNKRNAVHPENFSLLVARAITNQENGSIYSMHFGSGGATVDPVGNIVFAQPNTVGAADLNTPRYFEIVDPNEGAPEGNLMVVRHINGTTFSDAEIRCVIDRNEPFGQTMVDSVAGVNMNTDPFTFDEIALKDSSGQLVTHICFSPITKAANRIIEVVYVLRISIMV